MKLAGLVSVVGSADAAPTRQAQEVFNLVAGQIDEQIGNWHEVLDTDVAAFNALVRQVDLPAIAPPV
jgi:hypothetical protein